MSSKNATLPSPWRITTATPREASESASQCLRIASPPEQVEAERAAKLTWARAARDTRAHSDKLESALELSERNLENAETTISLLYDQRDAARAHSDALADALRSLLYETDHIEHIRPQLNKAAAALAAYEKLIERSEEAAQ